MKILFFLSMLMSAFTACAAVAWRNIDADHALGGRKASEGYLQGKVVLVAHWDPSQSSSRDVIDQLERIWQGFKNKQLVVLGAPIDADKDEKETIRSIANGASVTFPIYADAGLKSGEPNSAKSPFFYVVDETGSLVYLGHNDRNATQAIVLALTDLDAPKNLKQWKKFLDYELENLPAHAYNRLADFKKKHPKEAKNYVAKESELLRIADVKKVAQLVAFAKRAKDMPVFGSRNKAKQKIYQDRVRAILQKGQQLKDTTDPRLLQEVKNSLADLTWISATF